VKGYTMGAGAILALAVVLAALVLMAATRIPPDLILLGAVAFLFVTGVIEAGEMLTGFSNEGMITVAVLYVVGAGVVETGAIGWLAQRLFGRPRSVTHAIFRMSVPTAFLSGFMNNTPLVAMMIPAVSDWAKAHRIAPSKLMIPLSYAAILGGMCTLIGTSTNLVVNGLLIRAYDAQNAAENRRVA
jgi:Na+/H+ antiporter NhaD/arsenite permease-like protein